MSKDTTPNHEYPFGGAAINGFLMLFVVLIAIPALGVLSVIYCEPVVSVPSIIVLALLWGLLSVGFLIQQPNQSRVMIFFGKYCGSFTRTGFYWVNPFLTKKKVSLRLHNMDVEPI